MDEDGNTGGPASLDPDALNELGDRDLASYLLALSADAHAWGEAVITYDQATLVRGICELGRAVEQSPLPFGLLCQSVDNMGHELSHAILMDGIPEQTRIRAVRGFGAAVRALCPTAPEEQDPTFTGLWYTVITVRATDREVIERHHNVVEAALDELDGQVQSSNEWCQWSAVFALRHIRVQRSIEILKAALPSMASDENRREAQSSIDALTEEIART